MKAGGGKAKGSAFERDMSKRLTKWCSGQDKEYWFWRSPSSGAVATITEGNGEISGDIIALKPEGVFLTSRFSIEAKVGYPSSNFHKHLKGVKNDEIKAFWEQSCGDSARCDKIPMLIYKKKLFNVLIGIPPFAGKLQKKLDKLSSIKLSWGVDSELPPLQLFDMETFFEHIQPDDIKSIRKK